MLHSTMYCARCLNDSRHIKIYSTSTLTYIYLCTQNLHLSVSCIDHTRSISFTVSLILVCVRWIRLCFNFCIVLIVYNIFFSVFSHTDTHNWRALWKQDEYDEYIKTCATNRFDKIVISSIKVIQDIQRKSQRIGRKVVQIKDENKNIFNV